MVSKTSWRPSGKNPVWTIRLEICKHETYERYEDSHGRTRIQGVDLSSVSSLYLTDNKFALDMLKLGSSIKKEITGIGITDSCSEGVFRLIYSWVLKYGLPSEQRVPWMEPVDELAWLNARPRKFHPFYPPRPDGFDTWSEDDQAGWKANRWAEDSFDVMGFASDLVILIDDQAFADYIVTSTDEYISPYRQRHLDKIKDNPLFKLYGLTDQASARKNVDRFIQGQARLSPSLEYDPTTRIFNARLAARDHLSAARARITYSLAIGEMRICTVCHTPFEKDGKRETCSDDCKARRNVRYIRKSRIRPANEKNMKKVPKKYRKENQDGKL